MKTCTIDGCERKHLARGLCGTHYNQQHQPNRHRKVEVACGYCGTLTLKHPSKKYANRFCSTLCRDLWRIESDVNPHPARTPRLRQYRFPEPPPWWGKSCPIAARRCGWCGDSFFGSAKIWNRAYCSLYCKRKAQKVRRKGRETVQGYGGWTWVEFMHMARRFDYRCAYCGVKPERLDPDHVVAIAKGGPNALTNLLPSCLMCNSDKRDLALIEWDADRLRRGLKPVATSWTPEDRRYWHLTSA